MPCSIWLPYPISCFRMNTCALPRPPPTPPPHLGTPRDATLRDALHKVPNHDTAAISRPPPSLCTYTVYSILGGTEKLLCTLCRVSSKRNFWPFNAHGGLTYEAGVTKAKHIRIRSPSWTSMPLSAVQVCHPTPR